MALTGGNVAFTGYQQPDYSGAVESAGLPMQAISQGITQAQDYFKQQSEKQKLIKKSDIQIDAALKLFPDLAPTLQGVRDHIKDQNIPLDERASIAESVAGLIDMGTNQMRANAQSGIEERKLKIMEEDANAKRIQASLPDQPDWKPFDKEITINGQLIKVTGHIDQYGRFRDIGRHIHDDVMSAFSPQNANVSPNTTNQTSYGEPSTTGVNVDGGPGVLPTKANKSTLSNRNVPNPPSDINYNEIDFREINLEFIPIFNCNFNFFL
jgi:hypothetical protein